MLFGHVCLGIVGLLLGLLACPLLVLGSTLALLSRLAFKDGTVTRWLENNSWASNYLYNIFLMQHFTRTQLVLYGDVEEILTSSENIIYLLNHQSMVDWLIAAMTCVDNGLIPHFRILIKHTIRYFPCFGWAAYMRRASFINRSKFDEEKLKRELEFLKVYPQVNFIMTPEGKRYNVKHKHILEASERYAKEQNVPSLKHVLMPRYKGVWQILQIYDFKFDAIYDATIFMDNTLDKNGQRLPIPGVYGYFTSETNHHRVHIKRFPISTIPKKEEEFKKWMYELYVQKDRIMQGLIDVQSGKLSEESKLLEPNKKPRPIPFRYFIPTLTWHTLAQLFLIFHPIGKLVLCVLFVLSLIIPLCFWVHDNLTGVLKKRE